jgi:hypothetical protein
MKSRAVTAAPTHTSRQAIWASGSTLNIAANRSVTTRNESARLNTYSTAVETPPGTSPPNESPNADSAAVRASDTSRRKAIPRIMPNEKTRFMR